MQFFLLRKNIPALRIIFISRSLSHLTPTYAVRERYQFRQVALLAFAYATSFGSELAVASMLPAFFEQTFSFEHLAAGAIAACFSQASSGANSGIVPLIKKEITGQISGHVGAYGNFGSVAYLTIFSLTDAQTLFQVMGIAALICASFCAFFLKEPKSILFEEDSTKNPQLLVHLTLF
jgi:nitrate/nitrite transporter NarK